MEEPSKVVDKCSSVNKCFRSKRESDHQYWNWILKKDEEFARHAKGLKGRERDSIKSQWP